MKNRQGTRTDVSVLDGDHLLSRLSNGSDCGRVKLEARIRIGGIDRRSAVVPDAVFGLRFADESESYFFVEVDRGEMPIQRYRDVRQTYFAKKLLTYLEANRRHAHVQLLGIPNFRVLTVTTDQRRVDRILEARDAITDGIGSSMFLFAAQEQFAQHGRSIFFGSMAREKSCD